MNKNKDSHKVRFFSHKIREAKHGKGYYISLFILFFAIPLYVLSKFIYVNAGGWTSLDFIFVFILLAIATSELYREFAGKSKVPFWLTIIGVVSGIVVTIVRLFINLY